MPISVKPFRDITIRTTRSLNLPSAKYKIKDVFLAADKKYAMDFFKDFVMNISKSSKEIKNFLPKTETMYKEFKNYFDKGGKDELLKETNRLKGRFNTKVRHPIKLLEEIITPINKTFDGLKQKAKNLLKSKTPGKIINWTPSMSLKDAKEWVKTSIFRDKIFVHATNLEGKESIAKEGFKEMLENSYSRLGGKYCFGYGTYLGTDPKSVSVYGDQLVKTMVNVKNTAVIDASKFEEFSESINSALEKILDKKGYRFHSDENSILQNYVIKRLLEDLGHDSVLVKNSPYTTETSKLLRIAGTPVDHLVILNPKNIAVIK